MFSGIQRVFRWKNTRHILLYSRAKPEPVQHPCIARHKNEIPMGVDLLSGIELPDTEGNQVESGTTYQKNKETKPPLHWKEIHTKQGGP